MQIDYNEILRKAKEWTLPPFDNKTREEIQELIDTNARQELTDRFYKTLSF
jgi:phosphoglucomutase